MPPSIGELAQKALVEGDQRAWRGLFEALTPRLLGFARRLGATAPEAEDIVQQTWLRVIKAGFDPGSDFVAFVFKITRNLWLDVIRRNSRRPASQPIAGDGIAATNSPEPIDWLFALENAEQIRSCLNQLPEVDRQIIVWHFGEEPMTHSEIATRLGKTENQVKGLCFRAVRKLLECLQLDLFDK